MAVCDVCGNDYAQSFQVTGADGRLHTFDSFECAIHLLAPTCGHCGCKIVGHGMEAAGAYYCCAHCARHQGVRGVSDRAGAPDSTEVDLDAVATARPARP